MTQDNRESWLNRVAAGIAPLFEALDAPLSSRVRVAIGFTSAGRKGKAIGECWDNRLSADGHFEIFIRPDLAHAPDAMPSQIAAILAHELLHAAVASRLGMGQRLNGSRWGLVLSGRCAPPRPARRFLAAVAPILDAAGPFLMPVSTRTGSRSHPKAENPDAEMRVRDVRLYGRTARKWLEEAGAPLCPIEGHGPMVHEPLDDDAPEPEGRTSAVYHNGRQIMPKRLTVARRVRAL